MNTPDINTDDIPPLPGGGSWRFDELDRKWISNDPVPPTPAAPDSAPADLATHEE